jgi:hypothetical protein
MDSFTAPKIATRCYQAFCEVLFRSREAPFKKYGCMNSLDGKSNKTEIWFKESSVFWMGLEIPALIKPNDGYAQECLT